MNGYEIAAEQIKQFDEFQHNGYGDYIVDLSYKYDFEKEYTRSNEILSVWCDGKDDIWEWNTDWCEGQTDVIVNGIVCVLYIPKSLFRTEKRGKTE